MTERTLLEELDRDIWRPYVAAYADRDTEAYLDLHAPELVRVGGPAMKVFDLAEVTTDVGAWFADLAERDMHIEVDFRFTERLAERGVASERGLYRLTGTLVDGSPRPAQFGRFHTFSRRTAGRWRLIVDYDSTEGGTIGEADFLAGTPIGELEPFVGPTTPAPAQAS